MLWIPRKTPSRDPWMLCKSNGIVYSWHVKWAFFPRIKNFNPSRIHSKFKQVKETNDNKFNREIKLFKQIIEFPVGKSSFCRLSSLYLPEWFSNFWLNFLIINTTFFYVLSTAIGICVNVWIFKWLFEFFTCGCSQTTCRKRYKQAFHRYNQQFHKEIKQLEAMQPTAIDAMRVHR